MELTTVIDKKLCDKQGSIGKVVYIDQEIHIDDSVTAAQTTEQAYIHEVIHYIMFIMKKEELRKDEEFVDMLAHFIYQAFASAKY